MLTTFAMTEHERIPRENMLEGEAEILPRNPEALIDYGDAYRTAGVASQPLEEERRAVGRDLHENQGKLEALKSEEYRGKASSNIPRYNEWEMKREQESEQQSTAAGHEKTDLQKRHSGLREPTENQARNTKASIEELGTQRDILAEKIDALPLWRWWKKRSLVKQKNLLKEQHAREESSMRELNRELESMIAAQREEMGPIEERHEKALGTLALIKETKSLRERDKDLASNIDGFRRRKQHIANEVNHRLYAETEIGRAEAGLPFKEAVSAVRGAGREDVLNVLSVARGGDELERKFEHAIALANAVVKRYPGNGEMLWKHGLDVSAWDNLFQSAGVLEVYFPDTNSSSGESAIKNLRELLVRRAAFVKKLFEQAGVTLIVPEPLDKVDENMKESQSYGGPHTDPGFREVPEIKELAYKHYEETDKKFVVGLMQIGLTSPYDNDTYAASRPAYVWTSAYPQAWWDKKNV